MKKENRHNWSLVIGNWVIKKGFSLVELIVVITIIAVLSISSVVGFGLLGDVLRVREVTGMLEDIVKQEELKVLRGDFIKSTINFYPNYVVIKEELEDSELILKLRKVDGSECSSCPDCEYKLKFEQKSALAKKDEEEEMLQIKSVEDTDVECVDFKNSDEIEWSYQLIGSDEVSDIIRFVHLNIQRDNLDNPISIISGEGSKFEIQAPYGKKYAYDSNNTLINEITLTVEDTNENQDTITLK